MLTGTGRMVAVEWAGQEELGEESNSVCGFHREEQEKPVRRETDRGNSSAHTREDCSSQAKLGKDF